jgi:hypothetical protein
MALHVRDALWCAQPIRGEGDQYGTGQAVEAGILGDFREKTYQRVDATSVTPASESVRLQSHRHPSRWWVVSGVSGITLSRSYIIRRRDLYSCESYKFDSLPTP